MTYSGKILAAALALLVLLSIFTSCIGDKDNPPTTTPSGTTPTTGEPVIIINNEKDALTSFQARKENKDLSILKTVMVNDTSPYNPAKAIIVFKDSANTLSFAYIWDSSIQVLHAMISTVADKPLFIETKPLEFVYSGNGMLLLSAQRTSDNEKIWLKAMYQVLQSSGGLPPTIVAKVDEIPYAPVTTPAAATDATSIPAAD